MGKGDEVAMEPFWPWSVHLWGVGFSRAVYADDSSSSSIIYCFDFLFLWNYSYTTSFFQLFINYYYYFTLLYSTLTTTIYYSFFTPPLYHYYLKNLNPTKFRKTIIKTVQIETLKMVLILSWSWSTLAWWRDNACMDECDIFIHWT